MIYSFTPPAVVGVPVLDSPALFPVHRIYCVGRNYEEHAKEMGGPGREAPFFFMKPADTLVYAAPGTTAHMPVLRLPMPSRAPSLHASHGRGIPPPPPPPPTHHFLELCVLLRHLRQRHKLADRGDAHERLGDAQRQPDLGARRAPSTAGGWPPPPGSRAPRRGRARSSRGRPPPGAQSRTRRSSRGGRC